jgi:hypothetical protein
MKHRRLLSSLAFTVLFLCFLTDTALAQFYVYPRGGVSIPTTGDDPSYTLGLGVGYQWNRFFATELSYLRWIATGNGADGDEVTGQGILGYPMDWITPYLNGGVGLLHTDTGLNDEIDPIYLVGAGVTIRPVRFFYFNVGVNYAIVGGSPDFVEPTVGIGLSL